MQSARVQVWKLQDAPRDLRLLYTGATEDAWVALVPAEILTADLDELMNSTSDNADNCRLELANGDVVYYGSKPIQSELAGTLSHPEKITNPPDPLHAD